MGEREGGRERESSCRFILLTLPLILIRPSKAEKKGPLPLPCCHMTRYFLFKPSPLRMEFVLKITCLTSPAPTHQQIKRRIEGFNVNFLDRMKIASHFFDIVCRVTSHVVGR